MLKVQVAKEIIEVRASPAAVWQLWERSHAKNGQSQIEKGQRAYARAEGKSQFKYEILDVIPQEKFSVLWKALFVRLIFVHEVKAIKKGSEICYQVEIRGLFSKLLGWMLGKKIRENIRLVLKSIVKQLES